MYIFIITLQSSNFQVSNMLNSRMNACFVRMERELIKFTTKGKYT